MKEDMKILFRIFNFCSIIACIFFILFYQFSFTSIISSLIYLILPTIFYIYIKIDDRKKKRKYNKFIYGNENINNCKEYFKNKK